MTPNEKIVLETQSLTAHYGDFQALFGIDFTLAKGETVAIIGANGAGKSTFLKSIAGLLRNAPEAIRFEGEPIGAMHPKNGVALGIALVPEGRRLFSSLTVEENLIIGAQHTNREGPWSLEAVYELFPVLGERRNNPGQALSGGQQQMVAIGRALMSNPKVLLCDEISLGLAPIIIKDIYASVPRIQAQGTSMVVVEQDINQALAVANRVFCFQEGRVSLSGAPADLTRDQIKAAYFGLAAQQEADPT
ncbi:MAG: ABC transporter ATP-binding protein [Alphaproteobacteria bacterium]